MQVQPPNPPDLNGLDGHHRQAPILRSEFGAVTVRIDRQGLGPRLEVHCLRSGRRLYIDPIVLAGLVELGGEELTKWAVRP